MLTKQDLNSVRIIANLKVIKKLSKVLIKISNKIDVDYNVFLEIIGLKHNEKYDSLYLDKSKMWGSLSVTEKEIIVKWINIKSDEKRETIKQEIGIVTDEQIDLEVKRFNTLSDYFENLDFQKLEDCSQYLQQREKDFSKGVIIGKLGALFLDEYDDDLDTYGELYTELCNVLHIATNKEFKTETLLDSPLELLLEICIRLIAKTENEIEESFFIGKLVKGLMKFINISNIMNQGN